MLISYKWLKSYIPLLPEAELIADVFTFHICEVESLEKIGDDTVFDIKILPDRAHDLLSHRGVARDLAGVLGLKYNDISYKIPKGENTKLEIKIETENCRRYLGRIVRNIKVGESPTWIKEHLASMGQRSINNLVDATNIVMFDRGNPIHVFDLDKVNGKIIIRQAKEGEEMTTLDNKEVKLNPSNMVIADEKNILAIAGVKGGKVAEVDENTKNIIIEVANFDPISVRKTSKEINIFTDAVKRFENDLSPSVASDAMNDMTALVLEMCPPAKLEELVDIYPKKQISRTLTFRTEKISKILGLEIKDETVIDILKRFDISYKNSNGIFEMIVPDMRLDLEREEDMAEEIGRVLGYDKIKPEAPGMKLEIKMDETFSKTLQARKKLLENGYSEVMTYVFQDKGDVEVLASASDKKFLRNNLTDGLKESLNLNKINIPLLEIGEVKIFEIGTIFSAKGGSAFGGKIGEEMHIAWNEKEKIIEMTLEQFVSEKIFPEGFENLLSTFNFQLSTRSFTPWSIYPFIVRDIAIWVPEKNDAQKLKEIFIENGTKLLIKEPYLFDSFTKPAKEEGEKEKTSLAFRLVFQSYEKTLTDEEVNKIMEKINQKIGENKNWQVR